MAASRSAAARVTTGVLFLVYVIVFCSWETVEVRASTTAGDVSALNELAATWSASKSLNWNGDPCDNQWQGIMCDTTGNTSTVTSLNLQDSHLHGTLASAIGGLSNLQSLDLSRNFLHGQLPKELGELTNLQYLSLQWNFFTGPIPTSISNLIQLYFVGLNGNQLNGSIPASFGLLTKVTWLDLSVNNLTGSIPVSSSLGSNGIGLDNMTSVAHFHFNNNNLSGGIPAEIFSPPQLIHIILQHNTLGPNLPTAISNGQRLRILRLDNNQFNGTIPKQIGELLQLVNLNLQNNFFSGSLPDFSSLTNLQLLDVSNNQLASQSFPTWVTSLENLTTLYLALNNFDGNISSDVFQISSLQALNLSRNQITGSLIFPDESTSALNWIDFSGNGLTGISGQPEINGQPDSNVQIMLEGNPLCSNSFLQFEDNECGTRSVQNSWTPSANTSCSSNCKGGTLNRKTCACAYPFAVNVVLTAPTFASLSDTSAQKIEAEIASKMTSGSFIALDASQVVINEGLSMNDMQYQLNLLFFPLVGSSLSSQNESIILTVFNQRKISLAEGPFQVPSSPPTGSSRSSLLTAAAIAGIVIGIVAVTLIVVLFAVMQKIRADRAVANHPFASWGAGGGELGDAPKLKGARWFSLAELKLATNDWSKQNEIGHGGYGKVYKGVLKSGEIVAIKRAQEGSMQGAAEFKNEIELLSRVHHRNLVGLVGFCYESGEQALIYEFMNNGTLRDHLVGETHSSLSWQEKLDIALGSARGIAYLHDHANPPIIHRDIKTSNILLNDRQAAKVADFGLSKLAPEEGEMRVYSKNVKGTMGYLDPEYYTTFKLTDKSDVYSFGVVLLELLTAKAPIVNGKFVVREVRSALDRGGLAELRPLLDPSVQDLPNTDLEAFLNIALKCVEESSADRDRIADVVKQLERIGAHSHPNAGVHSLDIDLPSQKPFQKFNDDDDVLFPSSTPVTEKEAEDEYSGNSNFLRSSYRSMASRLRSPLAVQQPFSPLSQRAEW